MRLLSPFRVPAIASLWVGQACAAVGAEFYSVALVWTAAVALGDAAGYVAAVHAGVILAGALLSGAWIDRCRRSSAMVAGDLIRAGTLLALAVAHALGQLSSGLLIAGAALVALATAVFDPALQASVPALVKDPDLRHQTNSLFDATKRTARIFGPAAIAATAAVAGASHLFFATALAFLASLAVTLRVRPALDAAQPRHAGPGGLGAAVASLLAGIRAVAPVPLVAAAIVGLVVSNFTWGLSVLVGLVLFLRETSATPIADYGLIMAAYGAGNLATNLWLAHLSPRHPARWLILSKLIFGAGICALPFAEPLPLAMAVAAFAAANGPLENLAILHLVQSRFPLDRVAAVFRLMLGATFGGLFLAYLVSPLLYAAAGLRLSIVAGGAVSLAAGLLGLALWRRSPA